MVDIATAPATTTHTPRDESGIRARGHPNAAGDDNIPTTATPTSMYATDRHVADSEAAINDEIPVASMHHDDKEFTDAWRHSGATDEANVDAHRNGPRHHADKAFFDGEKLSGIT